MRVAEIYRSPEGRKIRVRTGGWAIRTSHFDATNLLSPPPSSPPHRGLGAGWKGGWGACRRTGVLPPPGRPPPHPLSMDTSPFPTGGSGGRTEGARVHGWRTLSSDRLQRNKLIYWEKPAPRAKGVARTCQRCGVGKDRKTMDRPPQPAVGTAGGGFPRELPQAEGGGGCGIRRWTAADPAR